MNTIHLFLLTVILFMGIVLYSSIVPCNQNTEQFKSDDTLYQKIADMIEKMNEDTKKYTVQNAVDTIQINTAIENIKKIKTHLYKMLGKNDNTIMSNTNSIETWS